MCLTTGASRETFKEDAPCGGAGGWLPTGVAWYRKTFEVPAHEGAAWVEFDGVMANSEVWLNGEKVGGRPYGYSTFRCDLSGKLKEGDNVLAVRTDTSAQPASRWYAGSGIYRHVRLVLTDAVHVVPNGVHVKTPAVSKEKAVIEAGVELSRDEGVTLAARILDATAGEEVAHAKGELRFEIANPDLWGVDDAGALPTDQVAVLKGDEVLDSGQRALRHPRRGVPRGYRVLAQWGEPQDQGRLPAPRRGSGRCRGAARRVEAPACHPRESRGERHPHGPQSGRSRLPRPVR